MRNNSGVSFLLSIFLIAILLTAQVAAGILVIGATEVADPVDVSDDIEFVADVLEFDGETTSSVVLTIDSTSYPMTLTGSNYTLTLAASTLSSGAALYPYDVLATGSAGNTSTLSSDVTVGDLVDPTIDAESVPLTVCYGDDIGVFASVSDNVAVSYVAINIDGTDYPLSDLVGDPTYNYAEPIPSIPFGISSLVYNMYAEDSSGNFETGSPGFIDVYDCIAPTISTIVEVTDPVEYGSSITITADVTDDISGVDSVELSIGSDIYTMTQVGSSDTYSVDIPTTGMTLGSQAYTITATDGSTDANEATEIGDFTVVDTTIPVITLVGVNPQTIEVGDAYAELGATATDNYDGDITSSISIDATAVDTSTLGSYTVTYDVSDSSGNDATQVTRTVNVVDTTIPVITLVGANPQTIEVGDAYTELGATALDNYDGDITTSISIDATAVDTSTLGSYTVTYDVSDSSGNAATTVTRTVNVVDTTIPVITLVGANPQTIEVGDAYTELGATALDNYDGDITSSISIDATAVDTSTLGSYTVTYDVSDSSGNAATQVTRTVDVVDTTAPVIVLTGADPQTVELDDSYTELGATATDNYDGDITSSISIDASAVDTSTLGSYTVMYDVSDSSGNDATQVTRTVDVVDTTAPVIVDIDVAPNPVELGTLVSFTADITDNEGVGFVVLEIDGSAYIMTYNTGSGEYEYTDFDTAVLGSAGNFTYNVTVVDTSFNDDEESDILEVIDAEAPVITMLGNDPETVEAATTYTDAGATAEDNVDGDLTADIITVNLVDTSAVGVYEVRYNVTDSAGNMANETRIVIVEDTTAPVITVLGNNPETVQLGDSYTDAGATATDSLDGDLTSSIIPSGTVDTTVIATYTITYDVTDSEGNSATATRTVNVVDTTTPTMSTSVSPNPVSQNDSVTFTADVTDNDAVASVELTINGVTEPMPNTGGTTYEYILDTTGMALGYYPYTIVATDSSGNTVTATGTVRVTIVSPMTVHINADKTSGEEDLDVSFASYVDAGGLAPFTYVWDFGNGDTDSNKNVRHVFTKDGTYVVTLTVYDQYGNEGSDSVTITVTDEETNNNPRNNIRLDEVDLSNDVVQAGDVLEAFVSIENIGQSRLENIALTIVIPDLGLVATSTAEDIRTGDADEFSVALDIPEDVPPGVYDVRIIVSNDEMKRVKHRDIVIE
ncbi:DUF5011 domain-containing protein [Candidatus Woesearchaeota archaeon]|nr:DUF5011 domain-containing protein [Candidatus Woesearchaeota archaeon]